LAKRRWPGQARVRGPYAPRRCRPVVQLRQAVDVLLKTSNSPVKKSVSVRVDSVVEWNSALVTNPAALTAYGKPAHGVADEISVQEHDALRSTMPGLFQLFGNAHCKSEAANDEPFANAVFLEKASQGARPGFRGVVLSVNKGLRAQQIDDSWTDFE